MRKQLFKTAILGCLLAAFMTVNADADGMYRALSLRLTGVESLADGFLYEGWLIVDGQPVSTGTFNIDAAGNTDPPIFMIEKNMASRASAFVVSIEPADDTDPAPAQTHYLAGDISDERAELTIHHAAALATDFASASGGYILETPSTGSISDDYDQGIWFLNPVHGGPIASLNLPDLPAGWAYEGWVAGMSGPVSTGRFTDPVMADSDAGGPAAGPDMTPPFPGQDFINPAMVLTDGYAAVISVEPDPDDSPAPFALKPLMDGAIEDVGAAVMQPLANRSLYSPSGSMILHDVVALNLTLEGVAQLAHPFVYEGWIIVDGMPVSTGAFTVDDAGNLHPGRFYVDAEDAAGATAFVVTIESLAEMDPAPSKTHFLAGDISDHSAELTIHHSAALGTDFMAATGVYILETPSTAGVADDYDQGIWFLNPDGPAPGLDLPALPEGWVYEGWIAGSTGPMTTGRFTDTSAADSDGGGPAAGPDMTPPFPGQDFVNPPIVLTEGYMAVISVEPDPDDSPLPFSLKPLIDTNIEDLGAAVPQSLQNRSSDNPGGMVTFSEVIPLKIQLEGVEPLHDGFRYEGWLISAGNPFTSGTFRVDTNDRLQPSVFLVDTSVATHAVAFVLTIEPANDTDPAPSETHYLAGDFSDGTAIMTVGHPAALGNSFSSVTGGYILETPSTASIPGDYAQGVWFLDPTGSPDPSLALPVLPDGWAYEGWVVGSEGPVSTGRFLNPGTADNDGGGPTAGPNMTPPFPGQDFINPAMVLTGGYAAVISVEPEPDDSPAPFALKPLIDMDIQDVGAGVLQNMENRSANNPSGTVTLCLPRPFGVRLDLPQMVHPGEPFWVLALFDNPDEMRENVPTFFILEVHDQFWFWPNWVQFTPPDQGGIDFELMDIPSGSSYTWVLNLFEWPDTGSQELTGLHFYGALLSDDFSAIIGEWAMEEWGFGPAI